MKNGEAKAVLGVVCLKKELFLFFSILDFPFSIPNYWCLCDFVAKFM